jgi:uncharacterized membrane protein
MEFGRRGPTVTVSTDWSRIMRISVSQSLAKTATFAVLHFVVAFSIAYLLTGSIGIASAIALLEPLANTVAYFFHERAWARFNLRRAVPVPAH